MTSHLTPAMENALLADTVRPILLVKIGTAGGDVRVWTGMGDLTFNGEVYQGVGTLGGVSPVQESADLQANGITFSLSGVPQEMIATALGQMRQGMNAQLWLGALDVTTGALIADPNERFTGYTDVPSIDESAETATISITAENRLIDLERARTRRYTKEDQEIDYPGDLGFDFVPSLQDKELVWGRS